MAQPLSLKIEKDKYIELHKRANFMFYGLFCCRNQYVCYLSTIVDHPLTGLA